MTVMLVRRSWRTLLVNCVSLFTAPSTRSFNALQQTVPCVGKTLELVNLRPLRVRLCFWYVLLSVISMAALDTFCYVYLRHAPTSSRQQTMAFLGHASNLEAFVFGGWQACAIGAARSEPSINVTISRSAGALPDRLNKSQHSNVVPGVPIYALNRTPTSWSNSADSSAPVAGVHVNAGRNMPRKPGLW